MDERIAIVGAGAVGGYVGAHMARAALDVTLIDPWPDHVEKMRSEGLALSGLTTQENFRVDVNAMHLTELQSVSKQQLFDIAFVSTKAYDTVWATAMIAQYLAPGGFVVSLQNGINEERIASVVGWGRTAGCIASRISVELDAPGHVRRLVKLGGTQHTVFRAGESHGRTTPRIAKVVELLSLADSARVTENLWGERWSKLAVNCMRNPIAAATGRGGNENDRDGHTRRLAIGLAGETVEVGMALGYQLEKLYGMTPQDLIAAKDGDGEAMARCEALILDAVATRSEEQRPSMGQDMAKGRRTEIDFINGLVVEKAAELSMPAPRNAAIVDVVKRIERGDLEAHPEVLSNI